MVLAWRVRLHSTTNHMYGAINQLKYYIIIIVITIVSALSLSLSNYHHSCAKLHMALLFQKMAGMFHEASALPADPAMNRSSSPAPSQAMMDTGTSSSSPPYSLHGTQVWPLSLSTSLST